MRNEVEPILGEIDMNIERNIQAGGYLSQLDRGRQGTRQGADRRTR